MSSFYLLIVGRKAGFEVVVVGRGVVVRWVDGVVEVVDGVPVVVRVVVEESGISSLGRYVFGSEISYNKAPPRLPGLAY